MWELFVVLLFVIIGYLYYFSTEDYTKYKQETEDSIIWKFNEDIGPNETVELALNIFKNGIIERLEFGYESNDTIRMFRLQRTSSGDIRMHCFDMRDRPDHSTRNKIIECIRKWMSKITPKNEELSQFQSRLEEEI